MNAPATAPKCPFDLPVRHIAGTCGVFHGQQVICRVGALSLAPETQRDADWAAFIANAINQHATLTAEVARLKKALEHIYNSSQGRSRDIAGAALLVYSTPELRGGA